MLALILAWESIEAIISGATGSLGVFVASGTGSGSTTADAETLLDSLGGDVWMGSFGSLTCLVYSWAFDVPRFLPECWTGYERIWAAYVFQIITFAAPTVAIQVFEADGFLSVGWLLLLLWIPYGGMLFMGGWNTIHPVWRWVKRPKDGATYSRMRTVPIDFPDGTPGVKQVWSPSPIGGGTSWDYERIGWSWPERRRAIGWLVFQQTLFIGSFAYRYFDSVFFMALLHGGVYLLILVILFFSLRWQGYDVRKSHSDFYALHF